MWNGSTDNKNNTENPKKNENIIMERLLRLLSMFWRPVQYNASFFAFMYALGYYCTQTEVRLHLRGAVPYELSAVELFFDLYLLCAVLTFIPRPVRRVVRAVVAVVLYAVAFVDLFCYVHFESTLTPTMLMLCFETNGREAGEFLRSYLGWDIITSKTGVVLLLAVLHTAWAAAVCHYRHRKRKTGPRLAPPVAWTLRALAGIGVLALFVYCGSRCWDNKLATVRLMGKHDLGEVEHELTRKDSANLYLPVYRMLFSLYANHLAARQTDRLVATSEHVHVEGCDFRSPQIVLIIGESYNKHRSQLYGYRRPTTPRQLRRMQDSTLVAFTDVVAPWNLTSFVFKQMFSLHNIGDEGDWCDSPLFPELFRKAGYHVTFLTNQFLPKSGEAVYDFSGGFFLNDPTLSRALFDERNGQLHRYDEGLLQDYDAMAARKRYPHQLTIFHLMGQHVDYRARFPMKTRRRFTPADYRRTDLSPQLQQVNADYDNAVLYNDSVVDQIIRRFEKENAVVIYVPDHGEECFNDHTPFYGRMHSADINYRLAREEFEIPFWIWASDEYRMTHPYGWSAIQAYRHRPFMTDALPHTLLFLGGIRSDYYRKEYDVLHADYNAKRPRLLKGTTDYNKLDKTPRR